jgi:hypothetical protein
MFCYILLCVVYGFAVCTASPERPCSVQQIDPQEIAMNWIFEVYGNTYNAMLMQNRRPCGNLGATAEASGFMPLLSALGSLFNRR